MGKKSWLYSVKKVFKPKKSSPLTDQRWEREDEVKETAAADVVSVEHFPAETSPEATNPDAGGGWGEEEEDDDDEEREDLERDRVIAAATKAAAEAADAAARLVRLAGRNRPCREERAAVVIQAFYRGYLARRALRALRAIVRLQALVRGHRVRKQAYMTLRCMQSLIRAQARVRARRLQLTSHQNLLFSPSPSSATAAAAAYHDPYLLLHPTRGRYHQDFSIAEEDDTCDEVNHLIHTKIPKSMRKCSPAYANPCHQRWSLTEHEKPDWLDLWMTARHSTTLPHRLSSYATASSLADVDGCSEKTVEMDPGTRRSPSHIPGYMAATQSARAKVRLQSPAAQQPFLVKCNSCHRRAMSVSATEAASSGGGKSSVMMDQTTWSPGRVGVGLNARRQTGYSPDWSGSGRD